MECLDSMEDTIYEAVSALDRAYTHLITARHGNHRHFYPEALFHKTFSHIMEEGRKQRSEEIPAELGRLEEMCTAVRQAIHKYEQSLEVDSPLEKLK